MKKLFFILLLGSLITSCTINKNLMFKTDTEYVHETPTDSVSEYIIAPNDRLSFGIFSNDGTPLINLTARDKGSAVGLRVETGLTYVVDLNGNVDLPEIGLVSIVGLTVFESESKLEKLYEEFHVGPYVRIQVLNKRVVIFPGSGGDAKVIYLENDNTNIIEALALAGGIADRGDASKVKLIRDIEGVQHVYLMDLSTIEGISYAQSIVQSNDIIYVEPVPEIAREALKDAAPVVSLISSFAVIWTVFTRFNN